VNRADAGDRLAQARAQERYEHEIHAIQAAIDAVVPPAKHRLVVSENRAQNAVLKAGTPSHSGAGTDTAIERVIGILHAQVLDGFKSDDRIVDLALQGHVLFGVQVILQIEQLPALVDQLYLLAVLLHRRLLNGVAGSKAQREIGFDVPGVAEIDVVGGNRDLIEHVAAERIQLKARTATRKEHLRLGGH